MTSYNNIIMVKKRSLSLPPPPYTLPPLLPVPNKPYGSVDVKHHLYLLMFSVGPANLQHCLSPTYLCFLSAPHTSNTVSVLLTYVFCRPRIPPTLSQSFLLMFSVSPAYLQHCLSSTYLYFLSAPHTSNTVSVLLTYVFCQPRIPPTLSQSYLLMFSVGPVYLQHCHSLLTYVFCRPRLPPTLSQPTYLCFFLRPRLPPAESQPQPLRWMSTLFSRRVSGEAGWRRRRERGAEGGLCHSPSTTRHPRRGRSDSALRTRVSGSTSRICAPQLSGRTLLHGHWIRAWFDLEVSGGPPQ